MEDKIRIIRTCIVDVQTGEILYNTVHKQIVRESMSFGRKLVQAQLDSFFRGIMQDKELHFSVSISKPIANKENDLF